MLVHKMVRCDGCYVHKMKVPPNPNAQNSLNICLMCFSSS